MHKRANSLLFQQKSFLILRGPWCVCEGPPSKIQPAILRMYEITIWIFHAYIDKQNTRGLNERRARSVLKKRLPH